MLSTQVGQLTTTWQTSALGDPRAFFYSRVTYTQHVHNHTKAYIYTHNYKAIQINVNETITSHHLINPRELINY